MKTFTYSIRLIGVMAALLSLFGSAYAQSGAAQGTRSRTDPLQREMQRKFEMEVIQNSLRTGVSRQPERYSPAVLREIQTDFLRIQIVDRKLMNSVTSGNAPDLEFVAKAAAEIKKRAVRLKKNLALPDFHSEASTAFEDAQELRTSISKLSSLIEQFVANPIFKESRLMDVQLAGKAKEDLEGILKMSDRLRQSSEKLRAAAKTQSQ